MSKALTRRRVMAIIFLALSLIILNAYSISLNREKPFRLAKGELSEQPLPLSRMATNRNTTFQGECKRTKLYNKTWGRSVAPFVDKIAVKQMVEDMRTSVSIPQTLAVYDAKNFSSLTSKAMKKLPDCDIKPSMGSGHTAQIVDGVYKCVKRCHIDEIPHSLTESVTKRKEAAVQARAELKHILTAGGAIDVEMEPQYAIGPWRIIVEGRLDIDDFMEVHWWISNGQPVFVCVRCDSGSQIRGSYFTSDFRELAIGEMEKCPHLSKPKQWDMMLSIVREMGKHLPGILCIDLYASDKQVYFSEFTFTRAMCADLMHPAAADALLFAASHGHVAPHHVTPEYVQRTIAARSWVGLVFDPSQPLLESKNGLLVAGRLPSALDVCLAQNTTHVDDCTQKVAGIAAYPLHCVVEQQGDLAAIGLETVPTIARILERLDWLWALGVAGLAAFLTVSSTPARPEREQLQMGNWCCYVGLMTLYKSLQPHFSGMLAPTPILHTVVQSFEIFKLVHPVTSTAVAISHLASYWCPFAALLMRKRSTMLWMFLCYELGTAFVNEYAHFEEADDGVRCMRVSYIQHAKQYAVNDVIRVYLLPPFFVYGYLLPKMIKHWAGL